jgi:hypothetical protein
MTPACKNLTERTDRKREKKALKFEGFSLFITTKRKKTSANLMMIHKQAKKKKKS